MPKTTNTTSVEHLNRASAGRLPGHIGLEVTEASPGRVAGRFTVPPDLVAPIGMGQVWDARAVDPTTGKLLAAFRCTQIILYPRG